MTSAAQGVPIERLDVAAYTIPTDEPEADGTITWDSTTMVVVEVQAGGQLGLGWTYEHHAAVLLIADHLAPVVIGGDALRVRERWDEMVASVRNIRLPGLAAYAISAVDIALWDLKARLLDQSLVDLLDARHESLPVYGSGGFTTYSDDRLRTQLADWADGGMRSVKMKVGRDPAGDRSRVAAAREAIGPDLELYIDANGALTRQQALHFAETCAELGVTWFEEPVSSDDVEGLRLLRDCSPPGMEITAGEYGTHLPHFRHLLEAGAVDCLQADVTRCGGITGVDLVGALCEANQIDLSAHTAPQASIHAFSAVGPVRHLEWFHDHVRIESMLLDGTVDVVDGTVSADRTAAGHGLSLKHHDAEPFQVFARTPA